MQVWDELTLEQYAVMITAIEEAYLCDVIEEYRTRLHWAETGDVSHPSNLDDAGKRQLIPHFAAVVADLVERGWIELTEPTTDRWNEAEPLTRAELRDALQDPASWIRTLDGTHRMVMVTYTDVWDRLARRMDGAG
ncbi:hypothetical protein GCM10010399_47960 [Dactylosporangium fulvum]|uniref:Uncharacterized protein n=1 Tax=Dactylosporangium fulvum TaxID=53359 RepID=A0ABY5VRP3_9ACTN|nr:hypothetical protein [Dactylosporangium fulvum]UWP80447.1 hypothetical protein Dfulv_35545 [Dactylosporangium fulvum]